MEWSCSTPETLDLWLAWLELSGKSKETSRTYGMLTRPLRQIDAPPAAITEEHCSAIVLRHLARSRNSALTAHAALKSFFRWCVEERRILLSSPMQHLPAPQRQEPPVRPLKPAELRQLMDLARDDEERLLLRLLATGMRAHEICGLRWDDIDGDVARLKVTKRRKPRLAYLDAALLELLRRRPRNDDRILPVNTDTLRRKLRRITARGDFGRVHPHLFRHTWASHFYRKTRDPVALQSLGGWANTQSMRRYIQTVIDDAAIEKAREVDLAADFFGE